MEDFFTYVNDWLDSGVYDFWTEAFAYFVEYMVVSYLKFINVVIPFAWGVAKVILEDLNVSALIDSAYSQFPSMSRDLMTAMRVPECINFALSAFVTKFVLRFVPGL
jgi:hypothetical protein